MAEFLLPRQDTRVRFPSPAPVQLLTVAAGEESQVRKVKAFGERLYARVV